MESYSYVLYPRAKGNRYWAKYLPSNITLPWPDEIVNSEQIPGRYLYAGNDIELFENDWLIEGESKRKYPNWDYDLSTVIPNFGFHSVGFGSYSIKAKIKHLIKTNELDRSLGEKLLRGTGHHAAMIRAIHLYRNVNLLP